MFTKPRTSRDPRCNPISGHTLKRYGDSSPTCAALALNRVLASSLFLLLVALFGAGAPNLSAASQIPHGTVELVAENQWITPGQRTYLGLHFNLEKGWHIYWRNPGDSGQPPRADWKLPAEFRVEEMEWPAPHRMGSPTIVDFGYTDEVMILVPIRSSVNQSTDQTVQIGADLRVLVCREICIPGKAQLSLAIPVQRHPAIPDPRARDLFATARELLPRPTPAEWKVYVSADSESFKLSVNAGHAVKEAIFFPSTESQVENAAPQQLLPSGTGFQLTLHKSDQLLKPIGRLQGVLVLSGNQPYAIDVPISGSRAPKERN
jgi:DsbC/DsbD-like thiol-disulfide interchange protein